MTSRRVGYLGPEGTFTSEAVGALGELSSELTALASIGDVFDSVGRGEMDAGVVPIENAIEGTVSGTIDSLLFDHDLYITGEAVLPIRLHLLARGDVDLSDLTSIHSYPHALAQCRHFLSTLPDVAVEPAPSTAAAARLVADSDQPIAAIASSAAARTYGLTIVREDVEDHPDNATRFVLVERDRIPAPSGHDRTTIVCFQESDRPGSLYGILGRFAARDLNLTKLESRPTKRGLGDYCFVVEFEGHVDDDVVADCLADLQAHLVRVKFLGSYPVTGVEAADRRDEVAAARLTARRWIDDIRGHIDH